MDRFSLRAAGLALAAWLASGAQAETSHPAGSQTGAGYRSSFADYRAYRDVPARPWTEANREMERLGGHVGHVKGQVPAAAPAAGAGKDESQSSRHAEQERP